MIIYTGRRSVLPGELVRLAGEFLAADKNRGIIVLVPDQLTLETEIMLFRALGIPGSFTLNVVSPKRLCSRVFEEAGKSFPQAIDEMGRAMIMGYLLRKNAAELTYFKNAALKPGFETRIVSEIRNFKQSGTGPEGIRKLIADTDTEAKKDKLRDIAILYEEYENRLKGHIQDGEDEMSEACARLIKAPFAKDARVIVYGFDITTPVVNNLICALGAVSDEVRVLLPLSDEGRGVYIPMSESVNRLLLAVEKAGLSARIEQVLEPAKPENDINRLAEGMFRLRAPIYREEPQNVELAKLKDELEEARFAAATVRKLVRERGWKYSDIRVICCDSEISQDTLESAFAEYEVPFFTQEGRSAASNPMCVFLRETLKLTADKNCSPAALLGTGFAGITRSEAEELLRYMDALELKPYALAMPFTRGIRKDNKKYSLVEKAEPIRLKLMKPILQLKTALKKAEDLKTQLKAIYEYLEALNCLERAEKLRSRMQDAGMQEAAVDDAQIWNKLMSTLDQLLELLGPEPLPLSQISDLIERAMASVTVKQLPLSPDCVEISTPDRAGMTGVKALLLIGAVQESSGAGKSVFSQEELKEFSRRLNRYLGPDRAALTQTRRMYIRDLLALAEEYIMVSWHSSSLSGEAVGVGTVVNETRRILPKIRIIGDSIDDTEIEKRLLSAREGARSYLASSLNAAELTQYEKSAIKLLEDDEVLVSAMNARRFDWNSGRIAPELASKLYGNRISVSRLESYAKCPFASFMKAGIKPDENEVYTLNSRDRGNILHECVELLGKELSTGDMSEEAAQIRMDLIADEVLSKAENVDILGDTAIAKAVAEEIKKTARRSARIFAKQAQNREFRPIEIEFKFGDHGEFEIQLSTGEKITFTGKIDRIDSGRFAGRRYVSVIDYKSSDKDVKPGEIYLGMQLQLIIYLSVAIEKHNASSAGVYYFSLKDELLKTESRSAEAVAAEKEDGEKLKGIVPDDAELLRFMAKEPGGIYNTEISTNGAVSNSKGKKATEEEFRRLIKYVRGKAEELTNEMYGGNTEIKPSDGKDDGVCRYCSYKNVCFRTNVKSAPVKQDKKISKMKELNDQLRIWEAVNETV